MGARRLEGCASTTPTPTTPLRARTVGPLHRFDPHVRDRYAKPRQQPDRRGVYYLADGLDCALAEAFPEQWPEVAICPRRRALWAAPSDRATLLDLTSNGSMAIGALATLGSGSESRRMTERWAGAIYEDLSALDGVRYRAAHQGGLALAAWERVGDLEPRLGTPPAGDALLDGLDRVTVALAAQGRYATPVSARLSTLSVAAPQLPGPFRESRHQVGCLLRRLPAHPGKSRAGLPPRHRSRRQIGASPGEVLCRRWHRATPWAGTNGFRCKQASGGCSVNRESDGRRRSGRALPSVSGEAQAGLRGLRRAERSSAVGRY